MPDLAILLIAGIFAGTLGGLLGIGGGVVLMPLLRFVIGLTPAGAAGTCILAVFFTTLGGSYRHFRLGHLDINFTLPVIAAGLATTTVFSLLFLQQYGVITAALSFGMFHIVFGVYVIRKQRANPSP